MLKLNLQTTRNIMNLQLGHTVCQLNIPTRGEVPDQLYIHPVIYSPDYHSGVIPLTANPTNFLSGSMGKPISFPMSYQYGYLQYYSYAPVASQLPLSQSLPQASLMKQFLGRSGAVLYVTFQNIFLQFVRQTIVGQSGLKPFTIYKSEIKYRGDLEHWIDDCNSIQIERMSLANLDVAESLTEELEDFTIGQENHPCES
jgi:hypothetical protein